MRSSDASLTCEFPPASQADVVVPIRRNTLRGASVSLVVHVIALLLMRPLIMDQNGDGGETPISVELNLEDLPGKQAAESAPPPPQGQPDQVPRETPPQHPVQAHPADTRRIIATNRPATPDTPTIPASPPEPQPRRVPPPPEEVPPPPPGMDFSTYVQQRMSQLPKSQGGAGRTAEQDANAARDAIIARNLKRPGTSGLFEIRDRSAYKATISFKGWTVSQSSARQSLFDVRVEPGDDIERAIIRKVIEITRQYYPTEAPWHIERLDQTYPLSMRREDQAATEDFLMREFGFSSGKSTPGRGR
ncbi:hypothetical protein KSF73_06000 [Burkholderiaceae bacterium DAT-1]|nr:hypothetical protein [Burkholderiaceae bacterium DAT-1]